MEKLERILARGVIREREPMSRHTTFRVGGPTDYYVEPENTEELAAVLGLCRGEGMPYYILGNGSNLLVSDRGYRGVIVALGRAWSQIEVDGARILAGAGAMLSAVARYALNAGLTGLEFASGIPGTVGGAVVMNAGAYGSEMKSVLLSASLLSRFGQVVTLPASELALGYRTSCIPEDGYVVLGVEMGLDFGDPGRIRRRMEELAIRRRERQPIEYPSAGSTFKRPKGHFAGKLIQDAGLCGFAVGGAQVSEKHCGFVINRGDATAADIMRLCRLVQDRVQEKFGVTMEMEVKILGEFEA